MDYGCQATQESEVIPVTVSDIRISIMVLGMSYYVFTTKLLCNVCSYDSQEFKSANGFLGNCLYILTSQFVDI